MQNKRQHLPIKQILRSKKISRAEVLLAQYCIHYLGKMATKVQGDLHPEDPIPYKQKQLVENLHYLSGAMMQDV